MAKTIDIHTHLFNLKYLPVAGIIHRYSNGIVSERIAIAIEKVLVGNTKSIFDSHAMHFETAMPIAGTHGKRLYPGNEKDFMNLTFTNIKDGILSEITADQLMDPEVSDGLAEFQELALAEGFITASETVVFNTLNSRPFSDNGIALKLLHLFGRLLDWICAKVNAMVNYLKWFRFMMRSESEILDYLRTKDEAGVEVYIHHMMDVDQYFGVTNCTFPYVAQVANMARLNAMHEGKIYGFVAFDPSKPDSLQIVKDAIAAGFKGVKFYPPMGYRAFDDLRYKANITALFDYCVAEDIPIFTHCNHQGFEAFPKNHSGHNSNPMFWYSVLKQEQYKKLRLCLAHAGGGEGWFADNLNEDEVLETAIKDLPSGIDEYQTNWNSSYAKIVYLLCLKYDNVYCDVAYLDEITDAKAYSNLRMRLLKLFSINPPTNFTSKIMYGSDWHMLFQEGKNQRFLDDFRRLFDEPGFTQQQRDDFFYNNAKRYLKLP